MVVSRGARAAAVATVLLALAVAGLTAWSGMRAGQVPRVHGDTGVLTVGLTTLHDGKRPSLPVVEGRTIDKESLSTADLGGKVVVVNVWGSWCAPCRAEARELAEVAGENSADEVAFIGIDVRDNPSAARDFVRRHRIPYTSLDDPDGSLLAEFAGILPVNAVPSTLVIDRQGGVAARFVGRIDASTLQRLVDDVLAEESIGEARS